MSRLRRCFSAIAFLHTLFIINGVACIAAVLPRPVDGGLERTFEVPHKPLSNFVQLTKSDFDYDIALKREPSKSEAFPLTDCSDPRKRCTWERTFGGPLPDKGYDIASLSNGGVVAVGHTRALKGIGHDVLFIRIDRQGQVVWRRTLGGLREDHAYGVVTSGNEDIIVSGYTRSKGKGKSDLWVCRMNIDGSLIWEHTYGGALDDRARTITARNDGGYVVAGSTQSKGAPEGDSWVIKIDETGQWVWEKTFGGNGEDGIFQIKALPDGSLVATGYSDVGTAAGFDLSVFKINKNGSSEEMLLIQEQQ